MEFLANTQLKNYWPLKGDKNIVLMRWVQQANNSTNQASTDMAQWHFSVVTYAPNSLMISPPCIGVEDKIWSVSSILCFFNCNLIGVQTDDEGSLA